MKIAKASEDEVYKLVQWFSAREDSGKDVPNWRRVVFGYQTLVENVCDPEKDYLDYKPGIIVPGENRMDACEPNKGGEG